MSGRQIESGTVIIPKPLGRFLCIIRGLPGSGKSTNAMKRRLATGAIVVEADMFHINADGIYQFKAENLPAAHAWCLKTAECFLNSGFSVIVSNTFIKRRDMEPYKRLAEAANCHYQEVICNGNYGSIHGVPEHTLKSMAFNWEE